VEVLTKLQRIDRRIIYALVIILIAFALLKDFSLPRPVTPEARRLFEAVEAVPEDKIVLVAADWGAATRGECWPQTVAVVSHLLKARKKFAIMGFNPQGPEYTQKIAEEQAQIYGGVYGVDWCNWGYKVGVDTTLLSLVQDIPKTIPEDVKGTPVEEIPMMKNVKTAEDIGLIVEFTGAGMLDYYLRRMAGVPIGQGCTAVIGPEQYTYLDSGQLVGLLVGMKGAAEYETLVDFRGQGTEAMRPQSLAHLLIIILIILGNIGMYAARRAEKQGAKEGTHG